MRQRVAILAIIPLLLYVGLVLDYHQRHPEPAARISIRGLERALARTGGTLESVLLSLDEPVGDPGQREALRSRLGWRDAPPAGERRAIHLQMEKGGPILKLSWEMTGAAAHRWAENHASLVRALATVGIRAPIHVQLAGSSGGRVGGPLAIAHAALDGVDASRRQPWADERAASVAGWSDLLPPGPHEVNIQVAARQIGEATRFWVAWPAMTGDY